VPFKKGEGGRPKGVPNKSTTDTAAVCRALVEDDTYRKAFKKRLHAGELAPALEAMAWHYAYGKPKELLEHSGSISMTPPKVVFELHRAST
jgi:hypothetical protein